ncbi:MAG: VWA domain-containing protein [Acidobacteriota bacterium]|nr:VWA domain-containing protein [Acidobacteriota bacterium]
MRLVPRLLLFLAVFASSAQLLQAQTPSQSENKQKAKSSASSKETSQEVDENGVVSVTTNLVRVPVSVRDRDGRYVVDLKKEDFRIYEDGVEQQVAHFGDVDEPVAIVLLIDISCSIENPENTKQAALDFTDSVLPIAFGRNMYVLSKESTRDHALLRERILELPDGKKTPCDNATRLYEAVDFTIHRVLSKGRGRRAVILLTDGKDSNLSPPGTFVRTLRDVSELGVPFYSIRLVSTGPPSTAKFMGFPNTDPAEVAKLHFFWKDTYDYIVDLARQSGGRSFPYSIGEELKSDFKQIGDELRHQYMLAYYPNRPRGAAKRYKIKVKVNRPHLNVRSRDSYIYIPSGK